MIQRRQFIVAAGGALVVVVMHVNAIVIGISAAILSFTQHI
jgi:hypothetical protein